MYNDFEIFILNGHHLCALLAQLDRVAGFEPVGRGFESLRVRHFKKMHKILELILAFISLGLLLFTFSGIWKVFDKAGHPGIALFMPFYNLYIFASIAGVSPWTMLVFLVPGFNLLFISILHYKIAKNFGHGFFFSLGLTFLAFIFYPILGYGRSKYLPSAKVVIV